MPVINQLWPAGPADTRMHNRPARPTAFRRNQKYPRICGEKVGQAPSNQKPLRRAKRGGFIILCPAYCTKNTPLSFCCQWPGTNSSKPQNRAFFFVQKRPGFLLRKPGRL